jgi:hypothetical protein
MVPLTQQRRRRPQIFNDYDPAAIEAALAKHDWLNYRFGQLAHGLARTARKTHQRVRYAVSDHLAVSRSPFLTSRLFLSR